MSQNYYIADQHNCMQSNVTTYNYNIFNRSQPVEPILQLRSSPHKKVTLLQSDEYDHVPYCDCDLCLDAWDDSGGGDA